MNRQDKDILRTIITGKYANQRVLSEDAGYSLGTVNKSIKSLIDNEYITDNMQPTPKTRKIIKINAPKNAIILAAGLGMRMVPINSMLPKGLLEVDGEPLVERLIKQLNSVGITAITIVVGFMKEKYDYLIDKYGVELVVNPAYAEKNNLASLNMVRERIDNTYVVPCDIWCSKNPFSNIELYSWYMVSDIVDNKSDVRVNRKMELVSVPKQGGGNTMIGIAYLLKEDADMVCHNLKELNEKKGHEHDFWEEALYKDGRMLVAARVIHSNEVLEIDTYEQLRELDENSCQLQSDAVQVISRVLGCENTEIKNIEMLKKGMTNRSFLFTVGDKRYIMRIPGEGTDKLISRDNECEVYKAIGGLGLCDDPEYIDPGNGYKITKYLEGVRSCDPYNWEDVEKCIKKLKVLHSARLRVKNSFDVFQQIDFYEDLWNGVPSAYRDYKQTKTNVFSLIEFIDSQDKELCLTHIDAIPDNFLFYKDGGVEKLQLTDWEYAGMQDPHVDLAMFSIYSYYDKAHIDHLMDLYFDGETKVEVRAKIYCYVAACGLLWSNWTEYKNTLGVEFGEYGLKQYRYAKEYFKYASECIESLKG